ncbi:MAG: hypothetical protein H0V34_02285 [Gammaproteobacteria bacterium]|nr:hypothetical protein [Gammaproteobacteria bacterium]
MEQLAKHPELAVTGTELARRDNTNALARLNSGTGAKLGLFASNGNQPILPGSPLTFTSWFDQLDQLDQSADLTPTPGDPLLRQILLRLRERGKVSVKPNFDMKTLRFIDKNSRNLTAQELVRAAKALKLQLP